MSISPTVFYLTHPKAGSQWIKKILHDLAPERIQMDTGREMAYFFAEPIHPGKIYPTVYTSKPTFEKVLHLKAGRRDPFWMRGQAHLLTHPNFYLLNWFNFSLLRQPYKKFFVLRDLRDTLISFYFSMKKTHAILRQEHSTYREQLTHTDQENGLIYLLESEEFEDYSHIQRSWLNDPQTLTLKFEDLIETPGLFARILDHCGINILPERLQRVIEANSFETLAGGRGRGVEDQNSHFRKGVAGDWKNYFTPPVKSAFLQKYAETLIQTGYEKDANW